MLVSQSEDRTLSDLGCRFKDWTTFSLQVDLKSLAKVPVYWRGNALWKLLLIVLNIPVS